MNNIFEQYGIKDVAEVTLYAIELDEMMMKSISPFSTWTP